MLRNRRGATSLRWLRALLDHGIEVHGQVVVCPGVNDGADPRRHPRRRPRPLPGAGQRGLRAARGEPLQRRGGHAAPHPRRGRPPWSTWSSAGRTVPRGPRPPPGVRRRRVLPAGRRGPSPPRHLRRHRPARQRRRHGPRLRGPLPRPPTTPRPAGPAGSSSRSTAPRPAATGRRGGTGAASACGPAAGAAITVLTGAYGRPGARPLLVAGPADAEVLAVPNELLRRQHRRRRPAHRRRPDPRSWPGLARRAPLPAPRRVPLRRAVPRRAAVPRTCPARSRWCPPTGRRCGGPSSRATGTWPRPVTASNSHAGER